MQISLICCPFQTSFGGYANSLKAAIERTTDSRVQWIGSNCGCGDAAARNRQFITTQCDYFEMPFARSQPSPTQWKRMVLKAAEPVRDFARASRAKRYAEVSGQADVINFHRILNAYGSRVLFKWLELPPTAARVVTVHEFDADQLASPAECAAYDKADQVIALSGEMRDRIVAFGVRPDKVNVVLHGTDLPAATGKKRDGLVFYGGHKIMGGKGLDTALKAIAILKDLRPDSAPTLTIHGHYGAAIPEEAAQLARDLDVEDRIEWRNEISPKDTIELYQSSLVCVLPYTGSFGGLAASAAAACSLPVVATHRAGLPDHLGDAGIWVRDNNPDELAARIQELLDDESLWQQAAAKIRKRAEEFLSWDAIAADTVRVYEKAVALRAGHLV